MFIYNITTKVNNSIAQDWIRWQKEEHIPEVMATDLFEEFKFYQLHDHDDLEGQTYIIQYFTTDKSKYENYIQNFAPLLKQKALKRWSDGFVSFRSLLESVQ